MTGVTELCDDKVLEHCDEKNMEPCDDMSHGTFY